MALGLIGLKVGMTQIYDDKGKLAPVTVLALGPCPILQVRTHCWLAQIGLLGKRIVSR